MIGNSGACHAQSDDRFRVLVIGGGPVGLIAALSLSGPPLKMNVRILEKSTYDDRVSKYDPTKAYLYLVNERGQVLLNESLSPSLLRKLKESGATQTKGNFTVIPASPLKHVLEDYPKTCHDPSQHDGNAFWVPRHRLVKVLQESIEEQERKREAGATSFGKVELLNGKQFLSLMDQSSQDRSVHVKVRNLGGRENGVEILEADLVIGADGINSSVREFLAQVSSSRHSSNARPWFYAKRKSQFLLRRWNSPASGLRLKVLQLPTQFYIQGPHGRRVQLRSEGMYSLRGAHKSPRRSISLGMMPVKPGASVRPANVIIPDKHYLWDIKTGNACKSFFRDAFPRLDWGKVIPEDSEWDRFVATSGTTFPPCQYCTDLQISCPQKGVGVALIGDAIHAFPPDIGQGINAGFGDVLALYRALCGRNIATGEILKQYKRGPPSLSDALANYEMAHGPEVRALIRFARCGPLHWDKVGKTLWTANVSLRSLLNTASFGLIPNAAISYAVGSTASFRKVMRLCDLTTVGILSALFAVLLQRFLFVLYFFTVPSGIIVILFS